MLKIKRTEPFIIDANDMQQREQALTRLIVVAAQRKWHKKKSVLGNLTIAHQRQAKDRLDSEHDSD